MKKKVCRRQIWAGVMAAAMLLVSSQTRMQAMQQPSIDGKSLAGSPGGINHATGASELPAKDPAELAARIEALNRRVEELSQMVEALLARAGVLQNGAVPVASPQPVAVAAPQMAAIQPRPPLEGIVRTHEDADKGVTSYSAASATVQAKATPADTAPKSLGPFRFGGDFRLRVDGILRPAYNSTNPSQPSLPHAQNVRGRYRFRFNMDAEMNPAVSFHTQLATGPANNPLTLDQDFAATVARHPFLINEAWIDFHPRKGLSFQGGKVQEVFADNLRFLFDDDVTFNGFNERFSHEFKKPVAGFRRFEMRAGQYVFSNPNIAVVTQGSLGPTGAVIGSTGRSAQLFHQGLILEQQLSSKAVQQFGADVQLFRNPNQVQFASTAAGVPIIVQNGLGITLSGPILGTGNATTTPGGAIYSAHNFQVARLTYRLDYTGLKSERQEYPLTLNLQVARNVGTGQPQRDAMLANVKIGRIKSRWDHSFLYMLGIKGANSMISQLTDDDLGTSSGVNIRSHFFRFDLGLAKGIQLQNLFFIQNELRDSGQFPNFFVPMGAYTPRQYRFQEQILFTF
jgi:hypothetical protein